MPPGVQADDGDMTTSTDPTVTLLGILFKLGWEPSSIGWDWVAQCPTCGTDLAAPALDLLVDLAWDHLVHAHPGD